MPTLEFRQVQPPPPTETAATFEGTKANVSFFYYSFVTSMYVPLECKVELSDSDLLRAAEMAGTFDFLNAPGEDIYNDLARKPE